MPRLEWVVVDVAPGQLTDPLVGKLLDGRYRLDHSVARGGMATVYRGVDTRLDRVVAVKVMHRSLAEDPDFVARFAREARAAARLSSPQVVAVYDQGHDTATGAAYLVLEYVAGGTLRDLIRSRGPLPPGQALAVLEPVLEALAAAHQAGLVHRDIKPENVLLADDGRVKVADFGLARAVETSALTATTGVLIGTVAYLAPEQVEHGTADPRTDVYAAGILLWEMLTGSPPYGGDSPLSVAYRHVHDDVPPPSTVIGGIPPALDDLVIRATRRAPAARPADGAAFLTGVRAARIALPAAAPHLGLEGSQHTLVVPRPDHPAGVPSDGRTRGRRRRLLGASALVLLVALVAATGWYLGAGRYTHTPRLLGLSKPAAESVLRAAGLSARYGASRFDEVVPPGSVLAQIPGPGDRVRRHGTVTLVLSQGPDRRGVPKLAGLSVDAATAALVAAGLTVGNTAQEYSATVPAGQVIRSQPPAGQKLRPGSPVSLVVSKGVELIAVPDETGQPQAQANTALKGAGFSTTLTAVFSDTVPNGVVVAQSPHDGRAPRGSVIALQVSKGPELVAVPNEVGQTQDVAQADLAAHGLSSTVRSIPGPGIVRNQTPAPGNMVRKGTVVTLYVF